MKSAILFLASLFLLSIAGYLGYLLVSQKSSAVVAAEIPASPSITIALSKSEISANSILFPNDFFWTETAYEGEKTDFVTREDLSKTEESSFLVLTDQKAGTALRKADILIDSDAAFMTKALRGGYRLLAVPEKNIKGGHHHLRPGNSVSIYFSPDVPHPASGVLISSSVRVISRSKNVAEDKARKELRNGILYLEALVQDLDVVTRALAHGKVSLVLKPSGKDQLAAEQKQQARDLIALFSVQKEAVKAKKTPKWRQVSIHRRGEIQIEKRLMNKGERQADE